jgi:hypothetical protein
MKQILFLAHDPGGYDVVSPVAKKIRNITDFNTAFHCVGPAARLDRIYAIGEEEFIALLKDKIASKQIDLLVTGTSWGSTLETSAVSMCKEAGVTTVSILDYWSNYILRLNGSDEELIYPDHYIMMDELACCEAISEGVPEEIIRVLGHPGLDRFIQARQEKSYSRESHRKVLLLSQPLSKLYGETLGYTEQTVIEEVVQAVASIPNLSLAIKFHPKDDSRLKEKYRLLAVEGDLFNILTDYDLVVGMNTIGLLHAILLGVPALSYQPKLKQTDACITNKLGLTPLVYSYEGLAERLESFIENQGDIEKKDMKEYVWSDGKSTDRISSFIQELV